MEKGCILPNNLRHGLNKDSIIVYSLTHFCACTADELFDIFQKRNEATEYLTYGYKRQRRRSGKKLRTLREPYDTLKRVQRTIKERLAYIPVSLSATWGKPGDSVERNVEPHRKNPYLITLDIKDAYPSIDTHTVYKKLEWALMKPLKYWCPMIETDEDKALFIRAVTHLCVSENQLPQWAPTSTQIQNIVMASSDIRIEKKLPELVWSHMVYSRYADDIAISFPHFSTMEVLKEKMEHYVNELYWDVDQDQLNEFIDTFMHDTFIITDNFEFSYLQERIEKIKFLISVKYWRPHIPYEEKAKIIGKVDGFKKQIKYTDRRIDDIQKEIVKILWSEWRNVNFLKAKSWNPQSNTDREINGLTFDAEGNRGISKKKKSQYMRLFEDLLQYSIWDLACNSFYKNKFKIVCIDDNRILDILSTLQWCHNHLVQVYGKDRVPKDLELAYRKAVKKRTEHPEIESTHIPSSSGNNGTEHGDDLPF